MPDDPLVWMVAILAGGVVIVVALLLGGMVEVGLKPLKLSFRRKEAPAPVLRERVTVLDEAEIADAEAGDVTGVAQSGAVGTGTGHARDVEVARKARITGSKLGDITGVSVTGADADGVASKTEPKKPDGG